MFYPTITRGSSPKCSILLWIKPRLMERRGEKRECGVIHLNNCDKRKSDLKRIVLNNVRNHECFLASVVNSERRYPKTSAWHLMMGMNLWGTLYMSAFMFLVPRSGGWLAVKFIKDHPDLAFDIFLLCLCGSIGQSFIFLTISRFGSLANSTITTTRKLVSILISATWNQNSLSLQEWVGVAMVFSGLYFKIGLCSKTEMDLTKEIRDGAMQTSSNVIARRRKNRRRRLAWEEDLLYAL